MYPLRWYDLGTAKVGRRGRRAAGGAPPHTKRHRLPLFTRPAIDTYPLSRLIALAEILVNEWSAIILHLSESGACECLGSRALFSANVPCTLKHSGFSRSVGKRPNGLTLIPWQRGRCLIWNATCVNTFAVLHLNNTLRAVASEAESADKQKHLKCIILKVIYLFIPVACEIAGPWGSEAKTFLKELGRRLRNKEDDPCSGSYQLQTLYVAIQRGNPSSVMGMFGPDRIRGDIFVS
ncbi:hypothetical protein EVAR_74607_1 [Eumeta japonica]|uniref:Uncharacterized protein n=1 Tax=Eumeta variegata TaxID=151549 RepID=A0A4C1WC98_EUMVA|nr:hypothetical protein EVAR_74607_1 [Eumeta japonica]